MSLKQKILDHVKGRYPAYVHKGKISRMAVNEWGYDNENAGRRCRELESAGIFRKDPNSKEAIYQYVPQEKIKEAPKTRSMAMFDIREPLK